MSTKHTPGPWIHLGNGDIVTKAVPTHDADGYTDVAAVYVTANDQFVANARLIAAAPELLEALQEAVALADKNRDEAEADGVTVVIRPPAMQAMYDKCVAAIAKAGGAA